ncbi:hypothetical protein KVR01_004904 [Diaporthe batatas]|uniref:uncharacterized protein n=1 Tax=Diaporthe batatas TaxID=748121 RepID=UPI001D0517CA|nr:uncharacterized protein KVR01_004904 [Diaporthe batatas]KAG8164629.1 hypothetical protein KVR01_004904 [Diaporthe batatas]
MATWSLHNPRAGTSRTSYAGSRWLSRAVLGYGLWLGVDCPFFGASRLLSRAVCPSCPSGWDGRDLTCTRRNECASRAWPSPAQPGFRLHAAMLLASIAVIAAFAAMAAHAASSIDCIEIEAR